MSQETPAAADKAPVSQQLPKNLPIELLPLYDWWKANGTQLLTTVAAVALLGGGAIAYKQHRAAKLVSANKELAQASSLEELEGAIAKYGTLKAGNAARLRLAKTYYDASRYEDALDTYDACLSNGAPSGFADVAQLGRAYALEGLNRTDDALAAYQAFDKVSDDHFLKAQAKMGIARLYTLQGKKDEAKKLLENLKAQKTDNAAWEMAIANLEGVIDRYQPRAPRSLFDTADAAAKALQAPAPVEPAVPAPAPVTLPAPAPAQPK